MIYHVKRVCRAALAVVPLVAAPCLPALAQEPPLPAFGPGMPIPPDVGMHGGPLAELARAEADQIAAQAVANLAHAPAADVQRTIRAFGVFTALRYYDVQPTAFHDAVTPAMVSLVRAAAQANQIASTDADRIVDHLQHDGSHFPPPHGGRDVPPPHGGPDISPPYGGPDAGPPQ